MKSFAVLAVGAALATAQSLTDLPQCGQTCINNMLALAPSLGCAADDAACLCNNADFGYGIRDCSSAACQGDSAAVQSAISYGVGYCVSALSGSASASGAVPALTGSAPAANNASATSTGANGAVGGAGNSSSQTGTPITTEPLLATLTENGSTLTTTTGSTTIYSDANGIVGGGAAGSGSESGTPITTEPLSATITENGSTLTTVTGSTTIYSGADGIVGGGVGGAGASTSEGAGAQSSGAGAQSSEAGASQSSRAPSNSGANGAGASSSTSSTSNPAAMATAAPGLVGAGLMALLAVAL